MSKFIPFRAVRPPRDKAHLVGSRSYVNYTEQDLEDKLRSNPFTFLHVINPELHPVKHRHISHRERFELVRKEYDRFFELGHFIKDEKKAFYLYRQTKEGSQYVGIIGGISVDDYRSGHIRIHEETLTQKEQLFEEYLEVTRFNAEPVLLTYDDVNEINDVQDKYLQKRPEFEFLTTDGVKHEMWLISKKADKAVLKEEFDKLNCVYIADGHHRSASSALLSEQLDEAGKYKDYFMAMMMPSSNLRIVDFNRLVKSLNGMRRNELLERLEDHFHVSACAERYQQEQQGVFGMYLYGDWYRLELKEKFIKENPLEQLDAQVLTDTILKPLLGIKDLKTDSTVDFLSGLEGMEGLEKEVDSGRYKVAFALYPVSVEQLKHVADQGGVMPPKSTWIEPKLRSGLTIYEIKG